MGEVEVSIVMPCLDEARTVAVCVRKALAWLDRAGVVGEVVVGDNGSTDGSQDLARAAGARVVDVPTRGYGAALRAATAAARGSFVIMGDSDDSYDFSELDAFLDRLRAGDDLVMGNRFRGGIRPGAMPWKNRLGNPAMSAVARLFFRSRIGDFWCGLRGFRKDAWERMSLRTNGMEYALEMIASATLKGMRVSEVPTVLHPDGRGRPPHLRPFRDGWRGLRFMLLYSPRWLFLYPGLVLMLLGALAGTLVWPGPVRVGGVNFDIHTLVVASAAVLVGFQSVLFAGLARVYSAATGFAPAGPRLRKVLRVLNFETGAIVGAGLALAGAGGLAYAVGEWGGSAFGPADPFRMMRVVVPSCLAAVLGCQVTLSACFLSLLSMDIRRPDP